MVSFVCESWRSFHTRFLRAVWRGSAATARISKLVLLRCGLKALFVPVVREFQPILIYEHFERRPRDYHKHLEILVFICIPYLVSIIDRDMKSAISKYNVLSWLSRELPMWIRGKVYSATPLKNNEDFFTRVPVDWSAWPWYKCLKPYLNLSKTSHKQHDRQT